MDFTLGPVMRTALVVRDHRTNKFGRMVITSLPGDAVCEGFDNLPAGGASIEGWHTVI